MPPTSDPTPEALFASWIERHEAGEEADLEVLCRNHPQHADALREAHCGWRALRNALGPLPECGGGIVVPPARSVSSAEAHAGEDATDVDTSSALLTRLAGRGATSERYRVEDEVGHGGMGVVLRVWDEDLRRQLAMKVMRDQVARGDPLLLARFLEEAQVTGQLDHPGVVPVHELGVDAEGRVYFTMKLVRGRTLKEVFDELARGEGGWSQARVLGLVLKLCEALSYAHAKGVIHRDLKPSNVMVGGYGEVYAMDWGLAKVLGREADEQGRVPLPSAVHTEREECAAETPDSPLLTMEGAVVGTPAYMPPEQARGDLSAMGPHSDVYSVGAMLYQLLAGQMPYMAPGEEPGNRAIWLRVQAGPPRPLHALAPRAPAELVALCEKAMARELDARYPDMSALAADLSAYLEGRVVQAHESGAWAEARKWIRRNKPLAGALGAGALALVAGLASSLVLQARAQAETARVLRLSDAQVLQELVAEADDLWPAHPDRIRALESWMDRARLLTDNLPLHRATLAEMSGGTRASEPGVSATADAARAGAAGRLDAREEQWERGVLAELVEELEELEELESGLLTADVNAEPHGWSVPKRLAFARRLQAGFAEGGEFDEAWARDLPAIRAAYPGLDLQPQMGLIPLGPDPDSRLWEFGHLMTGAPAKRGVDGELVLTEETGAVLVLLRGGSFHMGAQLDPKGLNYDPQAGENEGPVHEVKLSAFFLSKYELTLGQWQRLTGRAPVGGPASSSLLQPVDHVSWLACMDWLPRAGLTLPTEAQWEYGARGGTDTPWWTGSERESLVEAGALNVADQAAAREGEDWDEMSYWPELDDGHPYCAQVGVLAPNPFGLHGVTGNLSEWCMDRFDADFYAWSSALDPVCSWVGSPNRVYRDSSYRFAAFRARASARFSAAPDSSLEDNGMRPARAVEP